MRGVLPSFPKEQSQESTLRQLDFINNNNSIIRLFIYVLAEQSKGQPNENYCLINNINIQ
jgi:hypothetical protein